MVVLTLRANTGKQGFVRVYPKVVFQFDSLIYVVAVRDIYIKQGTAVFTFKVIMMIGAPIIYLLLTRQDDLPYLKIIRKLTQVSVYRYLADRRMFLNDFPVHFFHRRMCIQLLHGS